MRARSGGIDNEDFFLFTFMTSVKRRFGHRLPLCPRVMLRSANDSAQYLICLRCKMPVLGDAKLARIFPFDIIIPTSVTPGATRGQPGIAKNFSDHVTIGADTRL